MLSLAVAFFCLVPLGDATPPRIPFFDKYVHAFLFGALTFVLIGDLSKQQRYAEKALWIAVVYSLIYGLVIEILQEDMHLGRAFEWLDFVADGAGVLVAVLLYLLFTKGFKR